MSAPSRILLQPHLKPTQGQDVAREDILTTRLIVCVEQIEIARARALEHIDAHIEPIKYEADHA